MSAEDQGKLADTVTRLQTDVANLLKIAAAQQVSLGIVGRAVAAHEEILRRMGELERPEAPRAN
jgi:hypothetical protein